MDILGGTDSGCVVARDSIVASKVTCGVIERLLWDAMEALERKLLHVNRHI